MLVSDSTSHHFNGSRLRFDLKVCGELMQRLGGQLEIGGIAKSITDGLVEDFGCAFARLWIVNDDRATLRLVASSGLYTRLDGSFATVPMGAFKVSKIAQHRIPFLSNCLSEESWVKDRTWAIANQIQGFAGLPLVFNDQSIGVLAVFSRGPLSAEFLEVLQILSIATTAAIATALEHQRTTDVRAVSEIPCETPVLSEQLSQILGHSRLSLLGLEKPLPLAIHQLLIATAHPFKMLSDCYCRLIYESTSVCLEYILAYSLSSDPATEFPWLTPELEAIAQQVEQLHGTFRIETEAAIAKLLIQVPWQQIPSLPSHSELSEREQEVIRLLAQGYRDRDIANQLYISERTVKFHSQNILTKLGVRTRLQAVYEATRQGLIG